MLQLLPPASSTPHPFHKLLVICGLSLAYAITVLYCFFVFYRLLYYCWTAL